MTLICGQLAADEDKCHVRHRRCDSVTRLT